MELPLELYVAIYGIAGEVETTKSLRQVSKNSLRACEEYIKILLRSQLCMIFDSHYWFSSLVQGMINTEVRKDVEARHDHGNSRGRLTLGGNYFTECTAFKMSIKDLYSVRPEK